jgi:hypothetical protein
VQVLMVDGIVTVVSSSVVIGASWVTGYAPRLITMQL